MKKVFIILLTLLIFLQPFCKLWIFVSFKINQDYISKNICENRLKPQLNCKGNCVLMKKIKKAEQNTQNQQLQSLLEDLKVIFVENITCSKYFNKVIFSQKNIVLSNLNTLHSILHFNKIFQPPKC